MDVTINSCKNIKQSHRVWKIALKRWEFLEEMSVIEGLLTFPSCTMCVREEKSVLNDCDEGKMSYGSYRSFCLVVRDD